MSLQGVVMASPTAAVAAAPGAAASATVSTVHLSAPGRHAWLMRGPVRLAAGARPQLLPEQQAAQVTARRRTRAPLLTAEQRLLTGCQYLRTVGFYTFDAGTWWDFRRDVSELATRSWERLRARLQCLDGFLRLLFVLAGVGLLVTDVLGRGFGTSSGLFVTLLDSLNSCFELRRSQSSPSAAATRSGCAGPAAADAASAAAAPRRKEASPAAARLQREPLASRPVAAAVAHGTRLRRLRKHAAAPRSRLGTRVFASAFGAKFGTNAVASLLAGVTPSVLRGWRQVAPFTCALVLVQACPGDSVFSTLRRDKVVRLLVVAGVVLYKLRKYVFIAERLAARPGHGVGKCLHLVLVGILLIDGTSLASRLGQHFGPLCRGRGRRGGRDPSPEAADAAAPAAAAAAPQAVSPSAPSAPSAPPSAPGPSSAPSALVAALAAAGRVVWSRNAELVALIAGLVVSRTWLSGSSFLLAARLSSVVYLVCLSIRRGGRVLKEGRGDSKKRRAVPAAAAVGSTNLLLLEPVSTMMHGQVPGLLP